MKFQIITLRIAGSICTLFALLHCTFHKALDWGNSLQCLTTDNKAIMLTYHWISILILSFMSFVLLIQTRNLLQSQLKYTILTMFSVFYVIRIIAEFTYFGYNSGSIVLLFLCSIPVVSFILSMLPVNGK